MRAAPLLVSTAIGLFANLAATDPASAQCSVFDRHPCPQTVCSVFQRRPCIPDFLPPIGQDLRLTIQTAAQTAAEDDTPEDGDKGDKVDQSEQKIDTIGELFAALRACWVPPPLVEAHHGMQMSVRFSFRRDGEMIGTPRVTYVTPESSHDTREVYHKAITAALDRCVPMRFTNGMIGAIAGRPIAIRFVDNRDTPGPSAAR